MVNCNLDQMPILWDTGCQPDHSWRCKVLDKEPFGVRKLVASEQGHRENISVFKYKVQEGTEGRGQKQKGRRDCGKSRNLWGRRCVLENTSIVQ